MIGTAGQLQPIESCVMFGTEDQSWLYRSRVAGDVGDVDLRVEPAVVGLLDGDGDVLGAAVIKQRLEHLLGVLLGEFTDPGQVFGAFQLMQPGAHIGVFPPGAEGVMRRCKTALPSVLIRWAVKSPVIGFMPASIEAGCPVLLQGGVSLGSKVAS